MRLSRQRNWDTRRDSLSAALGEKGSSVGWLGLLVGDVSQARGGSPLTGHSNHQIGLDADIWLTPMPDRELTAEEREEMSAISLLADDKMDVDPNVWTHASCCNYQGGSDGSGG